MDIAYTPSFLRLLKNCSSDLQEEVIQKIEEFRKEQNHLSLKVHKLKGRLKGQYSFAVNYKIRIVFLYLDTKPKTALL